MTEPTADARLHAATRALDAYSPGHDCDPEDLIAALLDLAGQIHQLPAILSRAIHTHLAHTTAAPDDTDPEAATGQAFTQFAGDLIGMLLFEAHHTRYSDPMSVLTIAHATYQTRITEEWS